MPTTFHPGDAAPGAPAMFLTGQGSAPVGVAPLPVSTAFAWFLLQAPPAPGPDPDRAFLATESAEAR